jgi:hypothetical protein
MVTQVSQRSPIINIGDTSPTDRRATIVCPAHIIDAIAKEKCALFQSFIRNKRLGPMQVKFSPSKLASEPNASKKIVLKGANYGILADRLNNAAALVSQKAEG